MRKKTIKITAMLLAAVLLLSACSLALRQTSEAGESGPRESGTVSLVPAVTGAEATAADKTSAAPVSHAADPAESRTDNTGSLSVNTDVSDGFSRDGDVFTITKAGTYTFRGVSRDGQILVEAEEQKVEIILDGVTLENAADAPLKALAADKLTVKAAEGSYNEITDSRPLRTEEEAAAEEKTAGGAVYAKCDLTLSGSGTLVVSAGFNNGVHATKDLKIKELTLKVTAPNNALKGKDSVSISSGSLLLISTGGDGIKTEDSGISSKGNQRGSVSVSGGVTDIYAACDGIDAAYDVRISGEDTVLNIDTDTYSPYTGEAVGSSGTKAYLIVTPEMAKQYPLFAVYFYNEDRTQGVWAEAAFDMNCYSGRTTYYAYSYRQPAGYANAAFFVFRTAAPSLTEYAAATSGGAVNGSMNAFLIKSISGSSISGDYVSLSLSGSSASAKGIKADNEILIQGGTVTVRSTDDAVHANSDVLLENGANGLGNVTVSGGILSLTSGDDGIHADNIVTIDGGSVDVITAYEGVEGNQVVFNGGAVRIYAKDDGVNACGGAERPLIQVNGGSLEVTTASGDTDGLDSNGNYIQTGGFVLVMSGSSMGGVAGSVDVDGSVTVTGGTIIALGGICETPSGSDNCCTVVMSSQSFPAGRYAVSDGTKELFDFTLEGSFSGGWIASDRLSQGGSYQLLKDGSSVYSWMQSSQSVGGGGGGSKGGPGGGWGRPGRK